MLFTRIEEGSELKRLGARYFVLDWADNRDDRNEVQMQHPKSILDTWLGLQGETSKQKARAALDASVTV